VLPYTPHSCQPNQTINPTSTFFQANQITKHQKMSPSTPVGIVLPNHRDIAPQIPLLNWQKKNR
jgi:hypothetical protein